MLTVASGSSLAVPSALNTLPHTQAAPLPEAFGQAPTGHSGAPSLLSPMTLGCPVLAFPRWHLITGALEARLGELGFEGLRSCPAPQNVQPRGYTD